MASGGEFGVNLSNAPGVALGRRRALCPDHVVGVRRPFASLRGWGSSGRALLFITAGTARSTKHSGKQNVC